MVSVLPIGGLLVKNGSLSAQDFVTVIILSVGVITPVITMMSYSDDFRTMGTIFGEVRAILDAPEMSRPAEGEVPERNDLELKDVRFAYQEKEVLHGVSMAIPEGSFVALVGPSGSGKSTIARLIASLWDVSDGSISLGGTDIRQIPQEAYADKIAFVSQDNYLFNMSVRENIRIGRPSATREEVLRAAHLAQCDDFLERMPEGIDTMAGDGGKMLSGGERQRISLARALLKGKKGMRVGVFGEEDNSKGVPVQTCQGMYSGILPLRTVMRQKTIGQCTGHPGRGRMYNDPGRLVDCKQMFVFIQYLKRKLHRLYVGCILVKI